MIENRAVIHVVLEDSQSLVDSRVDLPKQGSPLLLLLQNLHAVGTHVSET